MANATAQVQSAAIAVINDTFYWPLIGGSTATRTYQTGEMIGRRSDGYAQACDDSAALDFLGIVQGAPVQVDASDADGAKLILIRRPSKIEMPLDTSTASIASNAGAPLYSADSGHVSLSTGSFGNIVGYLAHVVGSTPASLTGSVVGFAPCSFDNFAGTGAVAGNASFSALTATVTPAPIAGLAGSSSVGGAVTVTGGAGNGSANAGGAITVTGGAGGAAGVGGAVSFVGGAPASGNANGGATAVTGGAGSGTGTGGALTLRSGASAGASGTAGSVIVDAGAATGGTAGTVTIGATNASAVTIGAASVAVVTPGPSTAVAGGSTAAAGSTTTDAGVLPAGTARVYPTTAADDTKGVRIHASDKVTGRTIMIGNGVSNKILKIYAPSGGTINGAAGDAAFSSASGKGVMIHCLDSAGNTWLAW